MIGQGQVVKGVRGVFVGDFQTERRLTPEGFLVSKARIARTGIQSYRASELGLKGVDGNRIIRLHRPLEEVAAPEAVASFESQTVTDDHPPKDVNANNWPSLAVGDIHVVRMDGEYLCVDEFVVRDQKAIDKVQGGKSQVSCGYVFDVDMTGGTTAAGDAYDGVQRNIRGNHVAIVRAGRAGPNVRIADGNSNERVTMIRTIKIGDSEIPAELDEQTYRFIADAVNRHDRAMDDAKRGLSDAKSALGEAKDAHTTLQKDHDALQKAHDAMKAKVDAYEDSKKDDDDEDEEEEGADKKKGADSVERVKVSVADRYKRAVARNKKLKEQIPTADQMHAAVVALAQVVADAKTIVGDAVEPKGKSAAAIRAAVIGHVVAKDESLKALVLPIIGQDVAKASEAAIETAFSVALVRAKEGTNGRRAAKDTEDKNAQALGRRIHDRKPSDASGLKPITLGGRSDMTGETQTPGASA